MLGVGARLSFLRRALATRRWSFFKWFWLALGAYDLVLSQLVPKSLSDSFPKTYEALTTVSNHISWQAWAISGVAIAMMASIEYSFRRVGTGEAAAGPIVAVDPVPASGDAKPELRRIAVMPFVNLSGDIEQDFVGDGLASDVIAALSRIRSFFVIARDTTFQYKGKMPDAREIAKDLAVRYIIEGNVRKQADRLRVSVQLIDGATGHNLWSQTYDRKFTDLFDIQEELSQNIAGQLAPELSRAEYERVKAERPESLGAWELYQRGYFLQHKLTKEDQLAAQKYFEAAIQKAPSFALAHAGLSFTTYLQTLHGLSPDASTDKALTIAQRAVELDDREPRCHHALGVALQGKRNFAAADHASKTALDLNPSFAQAYHDIATNYVHVGRPAEAIPLLEKAIDLSPRDPFLGFFLSRLSCANLYLGRYDIAAEFGRKAISINAGTGWPARCFLASALGHLGRLSEARSVLDMLMAIRSEASLDFVANNIPTVHQPSVDILIDGLRKAGLRDSTDPSPVSSAERATNTSIVASQPAVPARASRPSIAVLPFANISSDAEQEYFADGMTDVLINALSKLRWLFVISRNSSFTFKGKRADHAAVRDALHVRYLVEGSVAKAGNRVRIAVGLIDTDTGATLWSNKFDRDLAEIFVVQDEIVRLIVAAIEPNIRASEIQKAHSKSTQNLDAYDHYLRGLASSNSFTQEGFIKAITEIDEAIRIDQNFGDAWALKANVLAAMVTSGALDRDNATPRMTEAAQRAVDLNSEDGVILSIAAYIYAVYNGDLERGLNYARRALLLSPNSNEVLTNSSWALIYNGEFNTAISNLHAAIELNPNDPRVHTTYTALACANFYSRQFDAALNSAREAKLLAPKWPIPRVFMITSLVHLGRMDEARNATAELLKLRPETSTRQAALIPHKHEWMREMSLSAQRAAGFPDEPGGATAPSTAATLPDAALPAKATQPSIAVLPFNNMSGDIDQEYFADGISEDIITALARVRQFMVIARNTTFTYKGKAVDVVAIAKELGVRYVLEGSVRKSGDKVRITAQLIDGSTGNHIWAERYDRELADIFAVQDEITHMVVGAIGPALSRAEQERARMKPPASLTAWDFYQRGHWHLYRFNSTDFKEAVRMFKQSIALDPSYSAAYAALANVYIFSYYRAYSDQPEADLLAAEENANIAMDLETGNALAHWALGQVYSAKKQFSLALEQHSTAIGLNPSLVPALIAYGNNLAFSGRASEAIAFYERAERISPLDPFNWAVSFGRGWAYYFLGKYREAAACATKALDGSKGLIWAYILRLASLVESNQPDECERALKDLLVIKKEFSLKFVRDYAPMDDIRRAILIESLRKSGLPEGAKATAEIQLSQAVKSSIAVLPFENLSGDPQQDFVGNGIASDIIANLSRIRSFTVISRNSTCQYKGKSSDIRQVAVDLSADYIVVGTAVKSSTQLRISVQLVDGKSGQNLWSQRYDRKFEDLFDTQDAITAAIVAQIEPELNRAEIGRYRAGAQQQLGVWENYYRGMEFLQRLIPEDQRTARSFFEQAVKIDPSFARGHAGISFTYWAEAFFGDGDSVNYDEALAAGRRAVGLDDGDPFCHFVLSHALMASRNFEAAIHEADVSLELNPSYAEAYHAKAICLVHTGQASDAIPLIEKGLALSPRDLQLGRYYARLALALLCARRYEEAASTARKALLNRAGWPAHAYISSALAHLGRLEEAHHAILELKQTQPAANLKYIESQLPTMYRPYMEHLLEGLRRAGLQ